MKTLAFFNNKGGVGKTTLAYHLAWMMAEQGRRVLVVDLDPQANLTSMFLSEDRWLRQIPGTYHRCVLAEPDGAHAIASDPSCLGLVKHYRSLVPLAMEVRKPIFHLKAADGAIGAHYDAVQHCAQAFTDLAGKISDRMGLPPVVSQFALVR